ncbi:MAG: hypothetical protein ACK4HM_05435, partial [Thermosynechococcus sp.]
MKRALHPLLALLAAVASQVLLISEIALGQAATRDCGNHSVPSFDSTAGTVNDNLICGSNNSNLAGLTQAIAVGITNTIQNANSQNSAVGIQNTVDRVNSQNHAFGSNNRIGVGATTVDPDKGNNNTAIGAQNTVGTTGTPSGIGPFPNAARNNNTAVGYQNVADGTSSTTGSNNIAVG